MLTTVFRTSGAALTILTLVVMTVIGCPVSAADAGNQDDDGGNSMPDSGVPCDENAFMTPSIVIGHTGEDFRAVEDGDVMPGWVRPQGGIGSRINLRFRSFTTELGMPESDGSALLTTEFLLDAPDSETPGVEGGSCMTTTDCDDDLTCFAERCLEVVTSQRNLRYATECLFDGSVHTPEMPIRFSIDRPLEELDGRDLFIRDTISRDDETLATTSVAVRLVVGDFIEPSWWEDED